MGKVLRGKGLAMRIGTQQIFLFMWSFLLLWWLVGLFLEWIFFFLAFKNLRYANIISCFGCLSYSELEDLLVFIRLQGQGFGISKVSAAGCFSWGTLLSSSWRGRAHSGLSGAYLPQNLGIWPTLLLPGDFNLIARLCPTKKSLWGFDQEKVQLQETQDGPWVYCLQVLEN